MVVADVVEEVTLFNDFRVANQANWRMDEFDFNSPEYIQKLMFLAEDIQATLKDEIGHGRSDLSKEQFLNWFPEYDQEQLNILWEMRNNLLEKGGHTVVQAAEEYGELFKTHELYGNSEFDAYTLKHQGRVSEAAGVIYALCLRAGLVTSGADEAGWQEKLTAMGISGIGHDLGKLGWTKDMLTNRRDITNQELSIVKIHPLLSQVLLAPFKGSEKVIDAISKHHEKWAGGGYPFGIKYEEIPILAQIYAFADVYDALVAARPYRSRASHETLIEHLSSDAFNPKLVALIMPFLEKDDEWLHKLSQQTGMWDVTVMNYLVKNDPSQWEKMMARLQLIGLE